MSRFRSGGVVPNQRGDSAEDRVANALIARGWTVLARNWVCAGGEIDLIACKGQALRFVEVKARRDLETEVISPAQVRRLRRAADLWLGDSSQAWDEACFALVIDDGRSLVWEDDPF